MLICDGNTDRSRVEIVFPQPSATLAFTVSPEEAGLMTITFYDNAAARKITAKLDLPRIENLLDVCEGRVEVGEYKLLQGLSRIGFSWVDGRAAFSASFNQEEPTKRYTLTDFERLILVAAFKEAQKCAPMTAEAIRK